MMALAFRDTKLRHPINFLEVFLASDDNLPAAAGLSQKKGSKSTNMSKLHSLPLCVVACVLFGMGVSSAQTIRTVGIPSNRIVSPVDDTQLVTLHGTVSPLALQRNDLGAAPDGLQLNRMHLVLKRSDSQEAALKQLIDEMHTPGSPNYHKWLTPDQFGAQFGPSDQDIAAVTTWLTTHGFNVKGVNPGRQTMEISGSVAQLRNAFHTQIHQYTVNGQTHYSNANDPQVPSALAAVVGGFVSLNNFPVRSYAHSLGKAQYNPATNQVVPQWTMGSASSLNFVLAPADYAVQYDLKPLYNAGTNGSGQTIAIINESNININLVNHFRSLFGLPANPPQIIIDGNDPGIDGINNPEGPNGASIEAYLDVEWAGAVAPNATVDLVIAGDTELQSGLVLAAERAIYSNLAPVISVSFGTCEGSLGSSNAFVSSLWEQAAAQGQSVFVSTGDSGSAGCDNDSAQSYAISGQAVSGFASTPYNIAVGGTDFFYSQYAAGGTALSTQIASYWNTTLSNTTPSISILGYIPEQPWNSSQYGLNINSYYNAFQDTTIAGGGGGASNAALCSGNSYSSTTGLCTSSVSGYPKPTWQTGVTGIPADGVRDIPDVSLFASSGINASFYPLCASDGDCQPVSSGTVQISGVGGTSASTPAFAGIMALVNQKYGRQGQANTVLYPLAKQFPASFHDVTNGNISVPCEFLPAVSTNCISVSNPIVLTTSSGSITEGQIGSGSTPLYSATAGYDLATGLGTVDAAVMVNNWNNVTLAATNTTMTPTPANSAPLSAIPHGTSVAIAGTVTGSGTPTGDVALMTDNTEQSQQFATKYALSSGTYNGSTTNLPGGTYNIWAQYGGDSVNGMSTSPKTQITVTPEASAIDLNMINSATSAISRPGSGPGTSVDYGTQLMLSALVAPSSQAAALETCITSGTGCSTITFTAPTGVVTFADNGSTLNTAAINNEGDAEYNAPFSVGAHSVTAAYAGDNSYNAAPTTSPITFTVVKDTPQIYVGASNQTSSTSVIQFIGGTNQPTVLNVLIENGAQSNAASSSAIYPVPVATPTGTITVSSSPSGISGTTPVSAGVDPSTGARVGIATITLPANITPATYNVSISYGGDSNYQSISGNGQIQIISGTGLATTTTATMTGSISPNSTISIIGTVTGSGTTAPTGGVIVYASGNYLTEVGFSSSTGNIATFHATLNSSVLAQGANFVTLQYTGDNTYAPSAFTLNSGGAISNPLADFSLIPQTSIVPFSPTNNATDVIQVASVNGFSGALTLSCTGTGVTCTAIPSTVNLSNGSNSAITLSISGASATVGKTYNLLLTGTDPTGQHIHTLALQAVAANSGGVASFALSSSGAITVTRGATSSNTSTISVTPSNGFSGAVSLACTINPTASSNPASCGLSSTSVTLSGTTQQTSTLTITTTAATAYNKPLDLFWPSTAGTALAVLLFIGVPRRRPNWLAMMVLLIVVISSVVIGCGGGGSSSSGGSGGGGSGGGGGTTSTGTTPGQYTVMVTGTSGSTSHTTTVTLTVN